MHIRAYYYQVGVCFNNLYIYNFSPLAQFAHRVDNNSQSSYMSIRNSSKLAERC